MNNFLTGLGLALVLALLTALIGPYFINWNAYRDDFATQASALLGVPVKVAGAVDARLLPSPYLRFRDLTAGDGQRRLSVAEVEITLSFGALLRGEFKGERVKAVRPRLTLAVAPDGSVGTPFSAAARKTNADRISFDRAEIVDGALVALTAAGPLTVERIDGIAEAGSLAGPFRFEGAAGAAGRRGAVRLSTGRTDPSGQIRVKLSVAPDARPETFDLDGALKLGARPSFEGAAVLTRPAPRRDERSDAKPWRIAGKVKADAARVGVEELDASYGPDDSGVRLSGRGSVTLGAKPRFDLALDTRQIDVDRMIGGSRAATPGDLVSALADLFPAALRPTLDGRLALGVRGLVLAGDVVQDLSTVLVAAEGGWRIERASAALPAGTTVKASGALAFADTGPGFAGQVDFASEDVNGFRRWLAGGQEPGGAPVRSFAVKGDVRARPDSVAIENAVLVADGARSSGRLSWRAAGGGERASLEAALEADRIDFDALGVDRLVAGALRGAGSTDVLLALDAKALVFGGVRMNGVSIDGSLDDSGLDVKRLTVADAEGATLSGAGRIASGPDGPEGRLAFDVAARRVAPLVTLARSAGAPEAALAAFAARAGALAPLKLAVELSAGRDGRRIAVKGDAAGGTLDARVSATAVSLDAEADVDVRLATSDGRRLAALMGVELSPLATAKGGEIAIKLAGAPARGMKGEGRLKAFGLEIAGRGALAVAPIVGVSASGDLTAQAEDLAALGEALGRLTPGVTPPLPASLSAKASFSADQASFEGVSGVVAGRKLTGRLTIPYDPQKGFWGAVSLDEAPFAALVALALSPEALAPGTQSRRTVWPAAPFGPSPARGLNGRLDVTADTLPFGAGQIAHDARFTLALKPNGVEVGDFSATFDGGRLAGAMKVGRSNSDATVSFTADMTGARAEQLVSRARGAPPFTGVLDLKVEAQGIGRTVAAIAATLTGAGTAIVRAGRLRGLDPAAIDRIEPRIEAGLALDAVKVSEALDRDLAGGDLSFDRVAVPFTLTGGILRSGAVTAENGGGRLGGAVALDLARLTLDADLTLGPNRPDAPQVGISFEGPAADPKRRIDATSLTSWLSVRAVERETKRIEAMEAELREKARLARLRAEEERAREEERKRVEEARLKEEAERRKVEEARLKAEEARRRRELDLRPPAEQPSSPGLPPALDITPPLARPAAPRPSPLGGAFGDSSGGAAAMPTDRTRPPTGVFPPTSPPLDLSPANR